MPKTLSVTVVSLALIFCFFSLGFCEEITITTYYPSPYGSYNELTTANNTYLATSAGSVGIGTTSANEKLEVAGNIKLSGAVPTYRITNVSDPVDPPDVATRGWVLAQPGGGRNNTKCRNRNQECKYRLSKHKQYSEIRIYPSVDKDRLWLEREFLYG